MTGKGDTYRPVDREAFNNGWDRIFGKNRLEDITSPCVEICHLDYVKKICTGCHRTLSEIEAWSYCNDDERRRILGNVEERKRHAQGTHA